jgi:hypothetical protein
MKKLEAKRRSARLSNRQLLTANPAQLATCNPQPAACNPRLLTTIYA